MGSHRKTRGAGSSTGPRGPSLESEILLGDFFDIALKDNKDINNPGNLLVVKKKIPTGSGKLRLATGKLMAVPEKRKVTLTDLGSGILSSWIICFVAHLAAGRSWKGSIKLNDFALLDGTVHAVVIPKAGNSDDRHLDGEELAKLLMRIFVYANELPAYMEKLISLLQKIPHGPLQEDYQNRLQVNCTQMTGKGRVNLAVLLMDLYDNQVDSSIYDIAVQKSKATPGWYNTVAVTPILRKAFFTQPLALANLTVKPPIFPDEMGAFDYIRNFGTHIGKHLREWGLEFNDAYELLIPDTFGNFLADLLDNLLSQKTLHQRVAEFAITCLPSPIQILKQVRDTIAREVQSQANSTLETHDPSTATEVAISSNADPSQSSSSTEINHPPRVLDASEIIVSSNADPFQVSGSTEFHHPPRASDDPFQASILTEVHYPPSASKIDFSWTDNPSQGLSATKSHINIIVIGHSSCGKSTTIGHFIYKRKGIQESEMDIIENEAIAMNKQSCKYAWVLDKLEAERERGITMGIKLGTVETKKYTCTIIDSPGHRDYLTNMISGISQADCAVLLIDSTSDNFEAISKHEHALLAFTLGVKNIICCCNKIDATSPPYSSDRYNLIRTEVSPYLKKIGYNLDAIEFIPISGLEGDNLVERSTRTAWYKGPTLLESIDNIPKPHRDSNKPLRLPLRGDYYRVDEADTVAVDGCVVSGTVGPEMLVHIGPSGLTTEVKSLRMQTNKKPLQEAIPGDNVTLYFSSEDYTQGTEFWVCAIQFYWSASRASEQLYVQGHRRG